MKVLLVLIIVALVVAYVVSSRRAREGQLVRRRVELDPVKKLAYEDITALGTELQVLDGEVTGLSLDEGTRADYQRALDAYEDAKVSGDAMTEPDDITHVTGILDDGRYAIACVRARVAGEPLPTRRPACFFDPRHGLSVVDVDYTPAGGVHQVRAGVRPRRRARERRGRPRHPHGDERLAAGALLAGRAGLRAVRRRLLRLRGGHEPAVRRPADRRHGRRVRRGLRRRLRRRRGRRR